MISLVVTGSIASGKSKLCKLIQDKVTNSVLFSADACVHELYKDADVLTDLAGVCPSAVNDGVLDRVELRNQFQASSDVRDAVESIVHPLVYEQYESLRLKVAETNVDFLVVEVPLLPAVLSRFDCDHKLVVEADADTRQSRCLEERELPASMFKTLDQLQTRDGLAFDFEVRNQGGELILEQQVDLLLSALGLKAEDVEEDAEAVFEAPEVVSIDDLKLMSLVELEQLAASLPMRKKLFGRSYLVAGIGNFYGKAGSELTGTGVIVQTGREAHGMVRNPLRSFMSNVDDFYVPAALMREHSLQCGHQVKVKLRAARDRDKFLTVTDIIEVEGQDAESFNAGTNIENLTPIFPDERFIVELQGEREQGVRVVDLVAPLGKGSRGLIVAPPRAGKTVLLKQVAKAISTNHPDTELIILLLDERPEEVTDFEETVDAQVYASTFDEPAKRHAEVAQIVLERAKRLVEQGKDVVLLLDSLTRLARGHNNSQKGGPIGSGGLNPVALQTTRKFFGAARNVEEGGSLTILATALVETESRMDDAIFEEFKGTGNLELRLSRELAEMRIYPAIHIPQSGTRNDDRLYHPDELNHVLQLRRQLAQMPAGEALETLLKHIGKTSNNAELLLRGIG